MRQLHAASLRLPRSFHPHERLKNDHLFRHPEVLRHLPQLAQALLHSLVHVHQQGAGEVLGLPLEQAAEARVVAYPQVVAGVQQPVPYGVGLSPRVASERPAARPRR